MINTNSPEFWDETIKNNFFTIFKSPVYRNKIKIIINNIKNIKANLLDIGVGYGYIEEQLVRFKPNLKLFGIDISKYSIENAKKKINGKFRIGNINNIPFKSVKFSYVLLLDILEHLTTQNAVGALIKINKYLTKNGTLIISVPINENNTDANNNHHLQKYDLNLIIRQLDFSYFNIIDIYYLIAFKRFYFLKNIFNHIFKFKKPNLIILICKKK